MKKPKKSKKPIPHRAEAGRILERWRRRLLLNEWTIDVDWMTQDAQDGVYATIFPDCVYKHARIQIRPRWCRQGRKEREAALVHELAHCLVQGLAQLGLDLRAGKLVTEEQHTRAVETLTQRIVNAVLWKA